MQRKRLFIISVYIDQSKPATKISTRILSALKTVSQTITVKLLIFVV